MRLGETARARAAGVAPPAGGRESDRSSAGGEGRRGPVDVRNEHGNTALAVAAALEDAAAAEATAALLLERGASPLALSGGWTPLHWAAQQGNADALAKLAAWEGGRGVDARASDTGDTPLMVAAAAGRVDCCEALLAAGRRRWRRRVRRRRACVRGLEGLPGLARERASRRAQLCFGSSRSCACWCCTTRTATRTSP